MITVRVDSPALRPATESAVHRVYTYTSSQARASTVAQLYAARSSTIRANVRNSWSCIVGQRVLASVAGGAVYCEMMVSSNLTRG